MKLSFSPNSDELWQSSPFHTLDETRLARTLADVLNEMAGRWPYQTAVIDHGRKISFRKLANLVGGLSEQIRATDAPPGPIALLHSVGVDAMAAWFACSVAGRPLLMLEPSNPPERNYALIEGAGATLILHDGQIDPTTLIGLNSFQWIVPQGYSAPLVLGTGLGADDPSMIFPTSGSTKEPKLIAYSAITLQTKVQASISIMGAQPGDIVLAAGSHSNYGFMHHALVFLFAGGCLCLSDVRSDGLGVVFDAILKHGVEHMRFTPSLFRVVGMMPEAKATLRLLKGVRFSGEPLLWNDLQLARRVLHPDCLIQNIYGSTESALFVWTDDRVKILSEGAAPIGRIYPLYEFQIQTDDNLPSTWGNAGELVISSPYQALGDWRLGVLDESRFPPDSRGGGRRLYYTGDIVRSNSEGELIMLGRKDRLVKVNGQGVSLIEIEAHLQAMPNCAQAAVLECPGQHGNRLVAFLTMVDATTPEIDPRSWLEERLPAYMIPTRFTWIERMPLLPSSKVDYKNLLSRLPPEYRITPTVAVLDEMSLMIPNSKIDLEDLLAQYQSHPEFEQSYVPPRTPMEKTLVAIWREVLNIEQIGIHDNFFELGGHSLLILVLCTKIETQISKSVPLAN